jgi:hypothetical protein
MYVQWRRRFLLLLLLFQRRDTGFVMSSCLVFLRFFLNDYRCGCFPISLQHPLPVTQLAQSRPKLVKVRPATEKQQAILAGMKNKGGSAAMAQSYAQKGKLALLQNEARMQALRQQRIAPKRKATFGDAVAFASGTKKGAAHKRRKVGGTIHRVVGSDGGQRLLKVPLHRPLRTTSSSATVAKRK